MGGYQLKELWGQFTSDLRQQWVKFRAAHLVQDEKYDWSDAGQLPRPPANTWGYSETGQRMGAVVLPAHHTEVAGFTKLSVEEGRDPVSIHMSDKELVLTARINTTIDTSLPSGGMLPVGAADRRSRGPSMG